MTEPTTEERQDRRDALLVATLPHVAFEGWTHKALAAGIADAGLTRAEAEIAFPGGIVEMVTHWQSWSDRRTLDIIEHTPTEGLSTAERLALAVRTRIEVNIPAREAVRRTLTFLALPTNNLLALRLTWQTVDALWYAAGDTATDFRYYSRRAGLAAIMAATVFYWLEDNSEAFADTWAFLDRRIADWSRVHSMTSALTPSLDLGRLTRPFDQLFGRVWRPRTDPGTE